MDTQAAVETTECDSRIARRGCKPPSWQTSAAENLKHTESLFAKVASPFSTVSVKTGKAQREHITSAIPQ
jgi:hypothetical protein